MFQSEPLCILTAGPTVDGRLIEQQVIDDIAEQYDPKTYNARINEDHWSWGAKFGSVLSVEKRENQLFAILKPNALFLNMIEQGQLLHTSCEITHDFAKTGKSYLTGLALTDEPASLGTTEIHLSAKDKNKHKDENKESLSSGATVGENKIIAPEVPDEKEDLKLLARIKKIFSISPEPITQLEQEENEPMDKETKELLATQTENITALTAAVTLLASTTKPVIPVPETVPETVPIAPAVPEKPEESEVSKLSAKVDDLVEKLNKITDENPRDPAGKQDESGYL
ncbi:GPO family capsid scaffolding protein [Moritella sp. F3]|uniref:GPO family capsid scaffolding protein n=1 Tax=Moritella sp. F3 TaxID=2718882 RepID=UPI0018E17352|nr:GPO family capsid scaffolding protein [Moritella sp. F3]GIC79498.1 phage capsid scaffolding protein [Moritella sp. F1]GIC79776.1 phage capsid scaffolding protein [Moritella sp. F3]